MKTFSGEGAEQYEAMKDALAHAADRAGHVGEYKVYDFLQECPKTSLAIELVDALENLGYTISRT